MRDRVLKYHTDSRTLLFRRLLNSGSLSVCTFASDLVTFLTPDFCLKLIYEHYVSEDAILSPLETQICYTVLLTCYNSPVQALWHTKGIVRHGGTLEQARFAQDLGLAIARQFGCKTGEITKVDEIEF